MSQHVFTDSDFARALLDDLALIRAILAPALGIPVDSMTALEMVELAAERISVRS